MNLLLWPSELLPALHLFLSLAFSGALSLSLSLKPNSTTLRYTEANYSYHAAMFETIKKRDHVATIMRNMQCRHRLLREAPRWARDKHVIGT